MRQAHDDAGHAGRWHRRTRRGNPLTSGASALALAFLVAIQLPAAAADPPTPAGWITLLHTNDIHGEYAPRPLSRLDGRPAGGFVALAARVASIRRGGPTVLFDAGDLMTGTPITTLDYQGVAGGAIVELMNRVGYDAMELGNHELDHGKAACLAVVDRARFPVLCANLADSATGKPFMARDGGTLILERGGVRIGIIGLILDDLRRVVPRSVIAGLQVRPSIAVAEEAVAKLDPQTDLIVVVTHQGLDACQDLAQAVSGIDVIVAGHDHQATPQPIEKSGVLIVETGSRLERLGRLDLRVEKDRVV
ncbi:MAG TPA: metallophosphatase, partial [Candidatus Udaeobacter sp.]|nr:metallophosphatase [Candidatus Udaeobacter sp.]